MSSTKTANPYGPIRETRSLVPGFDETDVGPSKSEYEEVDDARDRVLQARRIVSFLSKAGSLDLWENAPGGMKPHAEGSGEDRKEKRTDIAMAWERNENVDPGSDEPEPPMLNQEGGAQP